MERIVNRCGAKSTFLLARPFERLRREVAPCKRKRASQRRGIGPGEPHIGVATLALSTGDGTEDFRLSLDQHGLLVGRQFYHAPIVVGIAERREDALADAKVRVPWCEPSTASGNASAI
jgi:hypothetical protein